MSTRVKSRQQRERQEQQALVEWFELQYPNERLIVSANGGSRHILEAANLKKSGVRRGVPDLHLPVMKPGAGCLWIEFKPTQRAGEVKAKVTKEQKQMIGYLTKCGHTAMICYGIDSAMKAIREHLND